MEISRFRALFCAISCLFCGFLRAQSPDPPDWRKVTEEAASHLAALIRIDTTNPPGNETPAANYVRDVLAKEGIPSQLFAKEPNRANLVARLKGNGSARPILIMGHTDVVGVVRSN